MGSAKIYEFVKRCDTIPGLADLHLSNMVNEFLTLKGYR
jgi:hypothetical protein